jgi:hypothetical protein
VVTVVVTVDRSGGGAVTVVTVVTVDSGDIDSDSGNTVTVVTVVTAQVVSYSRNWREFIYLLLDLSTGLCVVNSHSPLPSWFCGGLFRKILLASVPEVQR